MSGRDHLEDLGTEHMLIVKWINGTDRMSGLGTDSARSGQTTKVCSCAQGNETLKFCKRHRMTWSVEQLAASQKGVRLLHYVLFTLHQWKT